VAAKPIIDIRELDATYEGTELVLNHLSCALYRREITCIVGRSGCGKSTLMRVLLGLLSPHAGEVRLFDEELSGLTEEQFLELRRRIGVLFQNGGLLRSITVEENVAMPLVHHFRLPEPVVSEMVRMTLGLVNLTGSEHLLPDSLSGGMMKRVGLARALILEPELLFLDEPGAGLDPVNRAKLDQLLLSLRDVLSVTTVVITHELESIRRIADRVIFMDEGTVLFQGTAAEAEQCTQPQVAEFFGS
jgi:phospholipid/cholesterol/gamma-HCH transport system ATP-binding protein